MMKFYGGRSPEPLPLSFSTPSRILLYVTLLRTETVVGPLSQKLASVHLLQSKAAVLLKSTAKVCQYLITTVSYIFLI